MGLQRASKPLFMAAFLACCAGIPGIATSMPAGSTLVKVSACNPKANVTRSRAFVGYAPGFYYRGGYWGDVYGARFYQPPITGSNPQLGIDYTNISAKTMHSIEFGLLARGSLIAEVRDVGTFSPGAEIKHSFGLSPNVFPIGTGLPRCVPLRITFEDGTKWRNPLLPPKSEAIYHTQ